jgi:hypothetical protein
MNNPIVFGIVTVATAAVIFLATSSTTVAAGQTTNSINTTTTPVTNFTNLLSENREFQICVGGICAHAVDVVYQGPIMLVLKSGYIDVIWKAVELAKKEGYKIDGISTYITTSEVSGGTVNVLVAMSK